MISLGEVISLNIFDNLRASPFFALMCDETTDVAVVKEVIIYARYLGSDRKVCTSFISMMEVVDGTAKTILAALQLLCDREYLDVRNKLVPFGSDGAAVMIGTRSGVATRIKQMCPWLISNHCVAQPDTLQFHGVEHLVTLADHFTPAIVDPDLLKREWELFKNSAGASDSLPLRTMRAQEVMALLVEKEDLADLFPNLFRIALIGLLIPTSTADCERGFSALKRIKAPLRNRLSNPITVQLMFIAIEGPPLADFDIDAACSAWASKRNRRIQVSQ